MKHAVVVGCTGYAGTELCSLLRTHPSLRLAHAMRSRPGPATENAQALDPERFSGADVVFLCTPHGAAAPLARMALDAGARVVDLSADFRLPDAALYSQVYGAEHPAPELLEEAVYGLTEQARRDLAGARLIANPGCYPTSILLPLMPLLAARLVCADSPIVADAKSGVSGAGKEPSETTHFGNVHENFRAYGVGNHRHAPEIHAVAGTQRVVFVPHLLPCLRGILATIYVTPAAGVQATEVRACLAEAYHDEPFVRILEHGTPCLRDVVHSNRCHLAVSQVGPAVVITSALDNLLKGAAGQALQNANLALGLDEELGL